MVKEAYVNFKTAKLLNEKGFIIDSSQDYWKIGQDGTMYFMCNIGAYTDNPNDKFAFYRPKESYPCPSQQMAMRYIREIHGIYIQPYCPVVDCTGESVKYNIVISNLRNRCIAFETPLDDIEYDTPEEAVDAALEYVLENLI